MRTSIMEGQGQLNKEQTIEENLKKKSMNQSILNFWSATYNDYPWWKKLALGGLCIAIGASTGFFISPILFPFSSIIGGFLAWLTYIIPVKILKNHHAYELEKQKVLSEDMLKLEQTFHDSIQNVQSLEKPMRCLLSELNQKNEDRAHSNQIFKTTVDTFRHQATTSAEAVAKLQESEENLKEQNQSLSSAVQETTTLHEQLDHTERNIYHINQMLEETQNALQKDGETFHNLASSIEHKNNELDRLCEKFRRIGENAQKTQHFFEMHLASLTRPLSNDAFDEETPSEKNQSSEDLQKTVLHNLEKYLNKQKNCFFEIPKLEHTTQTLIKQI